MIPDKRTMRGTMVTMSSSASGSAGLFAWSVLGVMASTRNNAYLQDWQWCLVVVEFFHAV